MVTDSEEKIFYKDDSVRVTQSRFIAYQKTYAMRNISSVSVFKIRKSSFSEMIVFTVGILAAIASQEEMRIVALLVVIVSFILMAIKRDNYSVRISINSGETNTLVYKNIPYVQSIVNALNEAIIFRG